jgi:hypothetical protein
MQLDAIKIYPPSVLLCSHSDTVQPHSAHLASMMVIIIICQNNEKGYVHTNIRKN